MFHYCTSFFFTIIVNTILIQQSYSSSAALADVEKIIFGTKVIRNHINPHLGNFVNFPFVALKGYTFSYLPCSLLLPSHLYETKFFRDNIFFQVRWSKDNEIFLEFEVNFHSFIKKATFKRKQNNLYGYFLHHFQRGNFGISIINVDENSVGKYKCEIFRENHGNFSTGNIPLMAYHHIVHVIEKNECSEKLCENYPTRRWCDRFVRPTGSCCTRCQEEFFDNHQIEVVNEKVQFIMNKKNQMKNEVKTRDEVSSKTKNLDILIIVDVVLMAIIGGLLYLYNHQIKTLLRRAKNY
ncbi:hypothetical protein SNEBB_008336 [Seison nebaliae]|nr:hypothetical protein SNEBB_008336 [Seison nebaliae]